MRAVIYARVSSDTGRQDTDRQVADLKNFASVNDIEVVKVFEDYQSGGVANKDRWVLKQCLDFSINKDNKITGLLMSEVSRLGRDKWEMMELAKFFHDHHLNVYFVNEDFSMFDADGNENDIFTLIFSLFASFAQQERFKIKERLSSGYKNFRAKGGKVGRKKGSKKTKEQLEQEYKSVLKELRHGTSIARTAKLCDTSTATVARLKKTFGIYTPEKPLTKKSQFEIK